MNKVKRTKTVLSIMLAIFIILTITLSINSAVIFQKGNPFPYIMSILHLNEDQTFVQVKDDNPSIFITKRNNYEEFHTYIEDTYHVSFKEQMGSGYIFSSDEIIITVTSEIYWKYYIVWTLSNTSRKV